MQLTDQLTDRTAWAEPDLLDLARAGDADAFGSLVAPRMARSLRMARAILHHESDAFDVVQDTFLAAWVHLAELRDVSRFDPWINQMLANRCRDALRRRGRVREVAIDGIRATNQDDANASLERTAILAAFDRLSISDRQVLVLHHLEDLTIDETGERLDIPPGTVKSRLFAARRALERALETQR